jgi:hypothetical protein
VWRLVDLLRRASNLLRLADSPPAALLSDCLVFAKKEAPSERIGGNADNQSAN